jgi:hypothetical protein
MQIPEPSIPSPGNLKEWLMTLYIRYLMWRETRRKYWWRCVRDGGGGVIVTPKPMRRDYAVAWVSRIAGPVLYVDEVHKHIFYHNRQSGG